MLVRLLHAKAFNVSVDLCKNSFFVKRKTFKKRVLLLSSQWSVEIELGFKPYETGLATLL